MEGLVIAAFGLRCRVLGMGFSGATLGGIFFLGGARIGGIATVLTEDPASGLADDEAEGRR
jgi:hypothetical protein